MRFPWVIAALLHAAAPEGNTPEEATLPAAHLQAVLGQPAGERPADGASGAAVGGEREGGAAFPQGTDRLQDLLTWAVSHSDPSKLSEVAEQYRKNNVTMKDVYGAEVFDALMTEMPNVVKQLTQALQAESSNEDACLELLEQLAEQLDDLDVGEVARQYGTYDVLYELAFDKREKVELAATKVLGLALQNNPYVQNWLVETLDGRGLTTLIDKVMRQETLSPPLYSAVAAALRNNATTILSVQETGFWTWSWRQLGQGNGTPSAPAPVSKGWRVVLALLESVLGDVGPVELGIPAEDRLTKTMDAAGRWNDVDLFEKAALVAQRVLPLFENDAGTLQAWRKKAREGMDLCMKLWPEEPEMCVHFLDFRDVLDAFVDLHARKTEL